MVNSVGRFQPCGSLIICFATPAGVWHFRLTVPADLREAFGLRITKRSLGTRDPVKASAWAYALGALCSSGTTRAMLRMHARLSRGRPNLAEAGHLRMVFAQPLHHVGKVLA